MALNIQKVAADTADGTFFVKTQGLEAHGHAELEVVGIPRPAVEPAAKLIDYVIETVIEGKGVQLKAGENVGIPLAAAGTRRFLPCSSGSTPQRRRLHPEGSSRSFVALRPRACSD